MHIATFAASPGSSVVDVRDPCATAATRAIAGSGMLMPFHSAKTLTQRALRPSARTDPASRARRRSPLCHDVIEFMLDGASTSSQESLDKTAATSPLGSSCGQADSKDSCQASTDPHALSIRPDDTSSDSDDDSDASVNCDSDNGFDGQCDVVSAGTTAECSPSTSFHSSTSSTSSSNSEADSSDSSSTSTSTEPSLNWWRRRFRSTRQKPQGDATPGVLSRRSTIGAQANQLDSYGAPPDSASSAPLASTNPSALAPMLTRLRRSVSSKSVVRKAQPADSVRLRSAATVPQKGHICSNLISMSLVPTADHGKGELRSRATPKSRSTRPATTIGNMTVSRWSMADAPATEDTFAPRWSMFKCKGAANLHIVSVPASVSSINHKDAFLFYPCLIHSPDPRRLSAASCSQIEDRGSGLGGSGTARDRLHGGTLLSQEYNRRKSVCSLASCVIYVWLGAHSSAIKRDAVTRVAMEVRDKELMGKASVLVIDESASANSARRKFLTQLYLAEHGERLPLPKELAAVYSQITPLSMAGDDMDFERALQRRKVVYGFWESISPATILSAGAYVNAAALLKVPAGGAVVLDTWTDVFVWWRNEPSSPAVRRCAANFAAMLVKDTCIPPRPASASVWHEIHGSEHVIFKTKFPDWPFVFASPTGPAEAVRQVAPTSGTALPPAALPTRSISRSALPVAVA